MFNWREPIQQALSCADHAKGDLGLELTDSEEVTYHISQADPLITIASAGLIMVPGTYF